MKQDQEYDDLEKIATLLCHIGDAFAAMYREVGKHLTDFGEKVAEAFEEAQIERDEEATRRYTCSAVSTRFTPTMHENSRHGGRGAIPLECVIEVPHDGENHCCSCGVYWHD